MKSEKPRSEWFYEGTVDCFQKIYHEEGWQTFFKGAGANALRRLGSALVLVFYDDIKLMMGLEGHGEGSSGD